MDNTRVLLNALVLFVFLSFCLVFTLLRNPRYLLLSVGER